MEVFLMVKGAIADGIRKHDVCNHMGKRAQGKGLGLLERTGMAGKGGAMGLIPVVLRQTVRR